MSKLVRIDDDSHQEIPLQEGKQVIGRGQLIDPNINPCFHINRDMADAQIIKQNSIFSNVVGDRVGFVHDKYRNEHSCNYLPLKELISKDIAASIITNKFREQTQTANVSSEVNVTDKKEEISIENESVKSEIKATDKEGSTSPSILRQDNEQLSQELHRDEETSQGAAKRSLIKQEPASPSDIKKVKTDKKEEEDKPQSNESDATASSSGVSDDASSSKGQPKKRERCMYGTNCYRKNPQHKAQFSHPSDPDWGTGAQAPCPWGYACARRDPRHWRDHSHPYGMHPPPPAGKKKRRVKRKSDEDTPTEELIVTGKRARKPLPVETWSGTDSDVDPYQTDDSDDWTPPSDISQSQDFSQTSQNI
ncbi:aprataxin and PNK-like factor isoform X2 [Battus philenor]|uniref:aprataxin and PNK-like factor isoform X2 n=1 Tax=Battus philenor TaxID=42288 RepID=UPI0035CEA17A